MADFITIICLTQVGFDLPLSCRGEATKISLGELNENRDLFK